MQDNASNVSVSGIKVPDIKDFLKAGVQFGHERTRWNPKMDKYIFSSRNNIHIIDLQQSIEMLDEAANFLTQAAKRGPIMFVATKRQARDIVKKYATESGSYFVTYRWLGGLLTNFRMIKKSLQKLAQIEDEFEKGVVNRTKFEVNKMKKEWDRMNKIYCGVKTMDRYPEAIVMIDCNYEKGALEEAKVAKIPVVSMVDTNSDPDMVDYVIPANDDAIKSIELVVSHLAEAIKRGNPSKWVKHQEKDYSNFEIPVFKKTTVVEQLEEKAVHTESENKTPRTRKHAQSKGIMEIVKEEAVKAEKKEASKEVKKDIKKDAAKKTGKSVKTAKNTK